MNMKKKKRKIHLKDKYLITVMTIVCVSLILLTAAAKVPFTPIRNLAGAFIVPFQKGISSAGDWLLDQTSGFRSMKSLSTENETLKEQVDELTEQNTILIQQVSELERLQQLYELDQSYAEYDKIAAQVIAKDPGNWYSVFTINRGSADGIAVDMNVISGGGLVGIVTEVGDHWATVRSIIDDSSNVSAMTGSTLDHCMVTGDLRMMDEGKLNFIQLNDEEGRVQAGDKIVTSDISEKFLKGILIGYISDVSNDSNNLTRHGTIVPVVDFQHIQEVLVITQLKEVGE